jgi:hypothetical protein
MGGTRPNFRSPTWTIQVDEDCKVSQIPYHNGFKRLLFSDVWGEFVSATSARPVWTNRKKSVQQLFETWALSPLAEPPRLVEAGSASKA